MNRIVRLMAAASAAAIFASCAGAGQQLVVSNASDVARVYETVELSWESLSAVEGLTDENVVVLDSQKKQVPSQVIFCPETGYKALIFQASVGAGESENFTVVAGQREEYEAKVFGRQVPERLDDYAWESNKAAYRLYGPALETSHEKLISPGIDAWVKSKDKLVIDERYARGDYHHDHGDGMDCYKVGRTLGAGSSVPYADGKMWNMSHNYITYETLANGPVRTTVKLTYEPYDVNGNQVAITKLISIDANQYLSSMTNIYTGEFENVSIAAGFVRHNVKETAQGEDWVAFCEEASDSKQPEVDGDIYTAVIFEGAEILPDALGHSLAIAKMENGKPVTYYSGAGWSKGGITDMNVWLTEVERVKAAISNPLTVTLK